MGWGPCSPISTPAREGTWWRAERHWHHQLGGLWSHGWASPPPQGGSFHGDQELWALGLLLGQAHMRTHSPGWCAVGQWHLVSAGPSVGGLSLGCGPVECDGWSHLGGGWSGEHVAAQMDAGMCDLHCCVPGGASALTGGSVGVSHRCCSALAPGP